MYRFRWITPVLVAAVMSAAGSGLEAQDYRNAIGIYGGGAWTSGLASAAVLDPRLEAGWSGGIEMERWLPGGRVGLRVGGSFSETEVTPAAAATALNLYAGDVSVLVRLLSPRPARVVAPFLSLGAGALHYNFTDVTPFAQETAVGDALLERDPVTRPAAVAGLGVDLAPTQGVGLRLEGVDRMALESPFIDAAGDAYDYVHHLRYTASVQVRFGRLGAGTRTYAAAQPVDAPEPTPSEPASDVMSSPSPDAAANADAPTDPALEARLARLERAVARTSQQLSELRSTLAALDRQGQSGAARTARRTTPETTEPAASRSAAAMEGQYYTVQVAAYESPAGARRMAERMSRNDLPTWVSRVERAGRVYHRVRVGIVPSEAEAQRLGRRLRAETGSPVWVVPVEPSASVTPDAVGATRAFMSDS